MSAAGAKKARKMRPLDAQAGDDTQAAMAIGHAVGRFLSSKRKTFREGFSMGLATALQEPRASQVDVSNAMARAIEALAPKKTRRRE